MTQPSISGMLAGRRRLSSIAIIALESMPWHGRLMVRALPRQATMGLCRSGRLFDIPLFFSYPFPLIKEVGFSQVETGGTKFRWLEFVLGRISVGRVEQ